MLLWTLLFTNAFPTTKEMTTNLLSMHTTMSIKKKDCSEKPKKTINQKITTIFLLQYIQPHQLEKCFLKKEKKKPHPPTLCFKSFFSLIPKWKDIGY
jgi:hypothetical protein